MNGTPVPRGMLDALRSTIDDLVDSRARIFFALRNARPDLFDLADAPAVSEFIRRVLERSEGLADRKPTREGARRARDGELARQVLIALSRRADFPKDAVEAWEIAIATYLSDPPPSGPSALNGSTS